MKKYTNMTGELKCVTFQDGTTQFLMRGQSVESEQPTTKVQPGIRITDVKKAKQPVVQESTKETKSKDNS